MASLPVYDIVLLLPEPANATAIQLSEQLAPLGTEFTLDDHSRFPHVSLYMANFNLENVTLLRAMLPGLCKNVPVQQLEATHYQRNEHGMFEVFFEKTETIVFLQSAVIDTASPLRTGLREKDPVGRVLADYIKTAPPEAQNNLKHYGYDEIGNFFKPHITFTRFKPDSPQADLSTLPDPKTFTGTYTTLALCEMGEHGTCTKIIAQYELAAA